MAAGSLLFYGGRPVRYVRLVGLAVVVVVVAVADSPHAGFSGRHLLVSVTLAICSAMELLRILGSDSWWGLPVPAGVEAAASGILAAYSPGTAPVLLALAAFDAGVTAQTVPAVAVGVVGIGALFIGVVTAGAAYGDLALASIPAITLLVGLNRRQYLLRVQETELRLADAERAREEQSRSARLAERASMAREIHDVLAHSLGALVLQLDAAGAVLAADPPDPARAARIVDEARTLAHRGLEEAREAVGTLRSDPLPLNDSLRELLEGPGSSVGLAGVDFQVGGTPRVLRDDARLTVYRTVQESLTNARKHAPGSRVSVAVRYDPDATVVTVCNNLPGGALRPVAAPTDLSSTGGGHGLGGLRERAALLGASLSAGARAEEWSVELRIPA